MLKTTILAALVGAVSLAHSQTTTLLASTFENGANGSNTVGKAFTGGTVGAAWAGSTSGATFAGSAAQHNGPGLLSSLLNRTATTGYGYWWGDLAGGANLPYLAGTRFVGSADFFLPATGANSTNGALFGLQAYANAGTTFLGGLSLYGGATGGNLVYAEDVDPLNGEIARHQAYDAAGNALFYTKGVWNTLSLRLDYAATAVTSSLFLNGVQLYGKFGAAYAPFTRSLDSADGDIGLSDVDVATGYLAASRGSAYVDNYAVVAVTPVPEPATLVGLSLGAALFRRRKVRSLTTETQRRHGDTVKSVSPCLLCVSVVKEPTPS